MNASYNSLSCAHVEKAVKTLSENGDLSLLLDGRKVGLEREALRVTPEFALSPTPHSRDFGSKLTHPHITTDYSEALLELVTPPMPSADEALTFLENIHIFINSRMGDDLLWSNSMPCVIKGGTVIPIADYGSSNIGQMKKIYRRGLGHRYGRDMQIIAGIHFNYSFSPGLLDWFKEWRESKLEATQFRSQAYMGVVRNTLRLGWVVPYLFGASPAVCKHFVDVVGALSVFDGNTLYRPNATSLRMGDIGYQNNLGAKVGFSASYDSLWEYVSSLKQAITTPCEKYEKIGSKRNNVYQQLNSSILQLDNEYYSTVRPRRVPKQGEMSILSMHRRGIEYIELRSQDINPFEPCGIGLTQLDFMELFTVYCLLANEGPKLDEKALREIRENELLTAHDGRDPNLSLFCGERKILLRAWGAEICEQMAPVSELLDKAHGSKRYSSALASQVKMFQEPECSPSARILWQMRARGENFVEFSGRKTVEAKNWFKDKKLDANSEDYFRELVPQSLHEQKIAEERETLTLEEYMRDYFSQLEEIPSAAPATNEGA